MFKPLGIDHVVLRVRDQTLSQKFYVDVLGCTVARVNERLSLIHLRCGDQMIDLVPGSAAAAGAAEAAGKRPAAGRRAAAWRRSEAPSERVDQPSAVAEVAGAAHRMPAGRRPGRSFGPRPGSGCPSRTCTADTPRRSAAA